MNQFNSLHGDESTQTPLEWNIQPPKANFKSNTSPTQTSPAVSAITRRLNHRVIYNDNIEVQPSELTFESNSEFVPDPNTTLIK